MLQETLLHSVEVRVPWEGPGLAYRIGLALQHRWALGLTPFVEEDWPDHDVVRKNPERFFAITNNKEVDKVRIERALEVYKKYYVWGLMGFLQAQAKGEANQFWEALTYEKSGVWRPRVYNDLGHYWIHRSRGHRIKTTVRWTRDEWFGWIAINRPVGTAILLSFVGQGELGRASLYVGVVQVLERHWATLRPIVEGLSDILGREMSRMVASFSIVADRAEASS